MLHNLKFFCTCLIAFRSSKHLLGEVWQALLFITSENRLNFFQKIVSVLFGEHNSSFPAIILDVCSMLRFINSKIFLSPKHLQTMKSENHGHSGCPSHFLHMYKPQKPQQESLESGCPCGRSFSRKIVEHSFIPRNQMVRVIFEGGDESDIFTNKLQADIKI